MFSYTQAVILGLMQGVTELFPVSSLGHTVIFPTLFGWHLDQSNSEFVGFIILTHFATALVLLGFFWQDWVQIVRGVLRSLYEREISEKDTYAKLGWLIIVSTIPVGILGLLFEKYLTKLFAAPQLVAGMLILNGFVLYAAEKLRKKAPEGKKNDELIAKLSWRQATGVGIAQCVALIPGFSRTGLTMTGSLINGLSHENAARYSFLLATPVIFAAALLKLPELFTGSATVLKVSFLGAFSSAIAAYLSIRFLTKYFESKRLTPFAIYCIAAGGVFLVILS